MRMSASFEKAPIFLSTLRQLVPTILEVVSSSSFEIMNLETPNFTKDE